MRTKGSVAMVADRTVSTKPVALQARDWARHRMSVQYRKSVRRKPWTDAGREVGRAGDVYLKIAQAALGRIQESKDLGYDPAERSAEKAKMERQWQRLIARRDFAGVEGLVHCAEMVEFVLGVLSDELANQSGDFDVSVALHSIFVDGEYCQRVLHGAKLIPQLWDKRICNTINDIDVQLNTVMAVMERMHSWWLDQNLSMISQVYYMKRTWPRFVNFYLAGKQTMRDYALVLMPILADLGADERAFAKWEYTYDARSEKVLRKHQIKSAEVLQYRLEYSGAGVFDGLPEHVKSTIRSAINGDNGERSSAMAAGAFAKQ